MSFSKNLVDLEWRRGDMVKNGQKLKEGLFFLIKNLILEMSPIGMIQQTQKKNEIATSWGQTSEKNIFWREQMKFQTKIRRMEKPNCKNEAFWFIL